MQRQNPCMSSQFVFNLHTNSHIILRFWTLGTQVALNLLILIPRGISILHYVMIGKTYDFPGELALLVSSHILCPNRRATHAQWLAAHGPIYWICLILIINYSHCQIQICVSCLFGETGASIMGVQEPLTSRVQWGSTVFVNSYFTHVVIP